MKKIKLILDKTIEWLCITIMGAMTILVTWQVFTRKVLNNPSTITEQLAKYLFVWLVLYGATYVFGKRDHMAIVFMVEKRSLRVQCILKIIQEILIGVFALGVMVYGGYFGAVRQMGQLDAALQLPIGIIYSAIPISGIIIILYAIYNIISFIQEISAKEVV